MQSHPLHAQQGFTLVEAMIASVIIAIGFVGSFTLVGFVQQTTNNAIIRQELQMQANQILDLIEADRENIANYNGMNLEICTAPDEDETTTSIVRAYEWCQRLNDEAGDAQAGDTRVLEVNTVGTTATVEVLLEANNGDIQIFMKRMYGL